MGSRLGRALAMCAVGMAMLPAAVPAQGPAKPALTILGGTEALKVSGAQDEDTATGNVSVLNTSKSEVAIEASFQAASSDKVTVEKVEPTALPAGKVQLVKVTFAGLAELDGAATGQLVIDGGEVPVAKSVEVVPAIQPSVAWPALLIGGSFALAFILMLAVIGNMPGNDHKPLGNPAPGPKWKFDSWATTLTAAGGLLSVVLTQSTFPTYPAEIAKQELVNLSVLFTILLAFAPFLFQALRKMNIDATEEEAGKVGTNGTLLLSCSVTLWAVLGQLGAVSLLVYELLGRGTVAWFAIAALVLVGLLAIWYFLATTTSMVVRDWGIPAAGEAVAVAQRIDVADVDGIYMRTADVPLAVWSHDAERRSAEVIVPATRQPASWSLL